MRNKKMWKKFLSIGICTGMLLQTTTAFAQEQPTEIFVETEATEDVTEVAESEVEVTEGTEDVVESEVGVTEGTEDVVESEVGVDESTTEAREENEVTSSEEKRLEENSNLQVQEVDNQSDFLIQDGVLIRYYGKDSHVVVPDGVTKIGDSAFESCNSLKSIVLPESIYEIGNKSFYSCSSLESIVLPENVDIIGDEAFTDCRVLEHIQFPSKVTSISDNAITGCVALKNLTLPEGMTEVDLLLVDVEESLYLPSTLQKIINFNFDSNKIKFYSSAEFYDYNNKVNIIEGIEGHNFPITFDYTYSEQDKLPFAEDEYLMKLTLDDQGSINKEVKVNILKYQGIGNYETNRGTLYYHKVLPDGTIKYMGNIISEEEQISGFLNRTFSINEGGTYIITRTKEGTAGQDFSIQGDVLFKYRGTDSRVVVPEGITTIAQYTFAGNKYVKEVILPDGVITIGEEAFSMCNSLTSIHLPDTIKEIGNWAFAHTNVEKVIIPTKVTSIIGLFYGCGNLKEVILPDGIEEIGDCTFEECDSLTNLQLPTGLKKIDHRVFSYSGLTTIKIPESITELSDDLFLGCNNLVSVELPSTLERIDIGAFAECTSLKEIYIPESVTEIVGNPFWNSGLTTIYGMVNAYAQTFAEANGYSFQAMTQPVVELAEGNTSLQKSEVEALVNANKMSDVTMKSANGVVFVFPRGTMKLIDGKEVYDFGSLIQTTYPEKEEISFAKNEFVARVHYNYSGQLPATAYISIPLGQEYAGQTLYYHKLLEDGTTKYITSAVVDSNGIYTITQDSCSNYLITTVKESVTNSGNNTGVGDTTGNNGTSNGDTTGNGTDNTVGNTTGGNETNSGDNTGNNGSVEDTNSTTGENNNQTEGNGEITSTGDGNVVMIYMIGLMVSIIGIVVGMVSKKKYFN